MSGKIERACQFVAVAIVVADRFCRTGGKGGGVGVGARIVVRIAVAVQVEADGVQLLKELDFNQPVPVSVVFAVARLGADG